MCNRVVQNDLIVKPGGKITVLMKGPGGEFELPFNDAIFGGPAKKESRNYWLQREGAVDVLVPNVTRFGEKNKGNARVSRAVLCVPRNTSEFSARRRKQQAGRLRSPRAPRGRIIASSRSSPSPPRPISLPASATTALRL